MPSPALCKVFCLLLLLVSSSCLAEEKAGCPGGSDEASLIKQYRAGIACWPAFQVDPSVTDARELGPLPKPGNTDPALRALGMQLFFDPRLSGSAQIACASCHDPDLGWADGRQFAIGHDRQRGKRNTPTILNAGSLPAIFWDGRAATLEQQALAAIINPVEMNADIREVLSRLQKIPSYRKSFQAVFGSEQISSDQLTQAISSFVRSINSRPGNFEYFVTGRGNALSDKEIKGLHLFRTKAACMNCHNGPRLTDDRFHNLGLHLRGRPLEDLGRYAVTQKTEDAGKFRTASLRDVALTAPYMHNGLIPSLRLVLVFYNGGGGEGASTARNARDPLFPLTSPLLKPLKLDAADIEALEAFLQSLSQRPARISPPVLPGADAP